MDAYAYLFYGLGQVTYAVAMADGKVQKEEEQKLNDIVVSNLEKNNIDFDYTGTIFKLLQRDNILNAETSYSGGMQNINLGGNRIPSLIPIIRFKLGDAFRFLIAHEQRHILQAKNVILAFSK